MSNENDTLNFPLSGKTRQFVAVLYPDDHTHARALSELVDMPGLEFWYILHDLDVKEDGTGELKKPHWHVVIRLENPRSRDSFAASLGLAANYLQPAGRVTGAIRYLVHKDDSDKYQYDSSDVVTNSPDVLRRALGNGRQDDSFMAAQILDYIESSTCFLSVSSLSRWCFDKGYYSAFRRSYGMFRDCLREHNMMLKGDDIFA